MSSLKINNIECDTFKFGNLLLERVGNNTIKLTSTDSDKLQELSVEYLVDGEIMFEYKPNKFKVKNYTLSLDDDHVAVALGSGRRFSSYLEKLFNICNEFITRYSNRFV